MTENYDVIYDIAIAMSRLPWNRNYKIYKNGTVVLDVWKGDGEVPQLDQKIAVTKELSMFIQIGAKHGTGCHILTRTKDIKLAQELMEKDLKDSNPIFDSSNDSLEKKMVTSYVFIHDTIKSTKELVNIVSRTTKMIVDSYYTKTITDSMYLTKYKLWEKYGQSINIYKVSEKEMEEIEQQGPKRCHKMHSRRRNNGSYGKTIVLAYEPNFIGDMPDMSKYTKFV